MVRARNRYSMYRLLDKLVMRFIEVAVKYFILFSVQKSIGDGELKNKGVAYRSLAAGLRQQKPKGGFY